MLLGRGPRQTTREVSIDVRRLRWCVGEGGWSDSVGDAGKPCEELQRLRGVRSSKFGEQSECEVLGLELERVRVLVLQSPGEGRSGARLDQSPCEVMGEGRE